MYIYIYIKDGHEKKASDWSRQSRLLADWLRHSLSCPWVDWHLREPPKTAPSSELRKGRDKLAAGRCIERFSSGMTATETNSRSWGILRRRCGPWRSRTASSRWSPCRSPPWSGWRSPPACVCTSAPCGSWWSRSWCHNPVKIWRLENDNPPSAYMKSMQSLSSLL